MSRGQQRKSAGSRPAPAPDPADSEKTTAPPVEDDAGSEAPAVDEPASIPTVHRVQPIEHEDRPIVRAGGHILTERGWEIDTEGNTS